MAENQAILNGEEPSKDSVNRVNDVPQAFTDWLKQNESRIKTARSIPYFMQDNGTIKDGKFTLKQFAKSTSSDINTAISHIPSELANNSTYLQGMDYNFDRDFFALLDPDKPVKLTIQNDDSGSYCKYDGSQVVLANETRGKQSPYFRKSCVYHEYGHSIDAQRNLWRDKNLLDIRAKHKTVLKTIDDYPIHTFSFSEGIISIGKAKLTFAEYIDNELRVLSDWNRKFASDEEFALSEWRKLGLNRHDLDEQILNTADTLKSLLTKYGWGHTNAYYKNPRLKETEYLAHAFENTFVSNEVFKKIMPTIYDDMVAYIKNLKPIK